MKAEKCTNCGCVIGTLETPEIWHEHVVCKRCKDLLAPALVVPSEPVTPVTPPHYRGLRSMGRLCWFIGNAVAVLSLIGGVINLYAGGGDVTVITIAIIGMLTGIIFGIFIRAMGECLLALRDIAMNSWRGVLPPDKHGNSVITPAETVEYYDS